MTNYSGVLLSRKSEYGYGLAYGTSYGVVSDGLGGWWMVSNPTPPLTEMTGQYPKGYYFEKVGYDGNGAVISVVDSGGLAFSGNPNALVSDTYTRTPFEASLPLLNPGLAGYLGESVQRYFLYDQIHIFPSSFSLGAVAVDKEVTAQIWSAFFETKVATSISMLNASGVTEDIGDELPYTFLKLEQREWKFNIDAESGAAVIAAKVSILIDGESYLVEISGVRAQSWVFPHNWKDPVRETLEWKTAFNTTYDGTESRAALISNARRSLSYSMYLNTHDAKRLENTSFGWQNRVLVFPLFQYFSQLTQPAASGASVIYLDTADKGFTVDGYAMLYNETTGMAETLSIAEVTPTYLSLVTPVANSWSTHATVFVATSGYIQGNLAINWGTNNFAEGGIKLRVLPAEEDSFTPDVAATSLYRGEEVLTREPDWARGLDWDMTYEAGVIDGGTGVVFNYTTWKRPKREMNHSWVLKGLTDIRQFREFLFRRRGMAVSFWMPSWRNDFRSITRNYDLGGTQFEFYDDNYILMSAGKVERQHIQIELNNGVVLRAKISAYTESSPGVASITLNAGFPVGFASSDIRRASWLSRFRLDTDVVELEWVHARLAKVTLPLATAPDFPSQDAA